MTEFAMLFMMLVFVFAFKKKGEDVEKQKDKGFWDIALLALGIYAFYELLVWGNKLLDPFFFVAYNFEKFGFWSYALRFATFVGLFVTLLWVASKIIGEKRIKAWTEKEVNKNKV